MEQVLAHTWPLVEWPMARLSVRLAPIAAVHGWVPQRWIEEGFGPASGCAFRLPSGVVILLQELDHLVANFNAKGPDIYADVGDVHTRSLERLLSEVLLTIGLDAADVESRYEPPTEGDVAHFRRVLDEMHRQGAAAADGPLNEDDTAEG